MSAVAVPPRLWILVASAFLLAVPLGALPPGGADGAPPQVPCKSEPLCPDLVVDPVKMRSSIRFETRTFGSGSCDVADGHVPGPGTYRLLRWTFNTPNVGTGDLYVGDPRDHPEWFEYGACHRHYHFREYADYRLWTADGYPAYAALRAANPDMTFEQVLAAHPELQEDFVAGNKAGFCVIDLTAAFVPIGLGGFYDSCFDQGISVGFADEYHASLSGQWIIVSGVAPGPYVLENEVNAERLYKELSYANNAWSVPVTVT